MITLKDVKLVLLVEMPDGKVHQSLIDEKYLKEAIERSGDFKVYEHPLDGIKITRNEDK